MEFWLDIGGIGGGGADCKIFIDKEKVHYKLYLYIVSIAYLCLAGLALAWVLRKTDLKR